MGASADAYSCLHLENAAIWSSHAKKKGSPGVLMIPISFDPSDQPSGTASPTACKGRKLEAVFQPAAGSPAAHPLHCSLTHGISHHLATPTVLAVSKTVGHSQPTVSLLNGPFRRSACSCMSVHYWCANGLTSAKARKLVDPSTLIFAYQDSHPDRLA